MIKLNIQTIPCEVPAASAATPGGGIASGNCGGVAATGADACTMSRRMRSYRPPLEANTTGTNHILIEGRRKPLMLDARSAPLPRSPSHRELGR